MIKTADIAAIAGDPSWFPHRFDPEHDAVHFVELPRRGHRAVTFVTDEYLPADAARVVVRRQDAVAAAPPPAPVHFIFHSAYCGSTLLARAVDVDGVAMGLKEPVLLNDLVGWKHRGGKPADVAAVLDDGLTLLSRPFARSESVVVKPSNVVNAMASAMLTVRPRAHALLLYAPLGVYLGSIARKGMWGRRWARDLLVKQLRDGMVDFGFAAEDYLGLTDLQAAAVGWLAQHALFARLAAKFGPRVRTLASDRLTAAPHAAMTALARHFALDLDAAAVARVVAGPAFTQDSKTGDDFARDARAREVLDGARVHADEIDKVAVWAEAVASRAGLSFTLDAPLLPG